MVDIDIDGDDQKMMAKQDSVDEMNEIDIGDGDGDKKEKPRDEGEEFDESSSVSDAPTGLVGLITNLSGVMYSMNSDRFDLYSSFHNQLFIFRGMKVRILVQFLVSNCISFICLPSLDFFFYYCYF